MLYLNEKDLLDIGVNWKNVINVIKSTVKSIKDKDFSQPIKPYLRYGNPKNRIIAMPAYVGGETNTSGIKWIASFPDNIGNGIPRAHSVVVLNDATTGKPICIINTGLLSAIRTASVSGFMIECYKNIVHKNKFNIGIIGMGVIGRAHLNMIFDILKEQIDNIYIYDKHPINIKGLACPDKITISKNWEESYDNADILITCTVSDQRYIDKKPKSTRMRQNVRKQKRIAVQMRTAQRKAQQRKTQRMRRMKVLQMIQIRQPQQEAANQIHRLQAASRSQSAVVTVLIQWQESCTKPDLSVM